jgi:hypothetical protein
VCAGSALHFVYQWTGYVRSVAWFAAVNESTWEHFKLCFWPGVLFALFEYCMIRGRVNNFWISKSIGLIIMPVVIALCFYGYKGVLGHHYLVIDIPIFVLAVIIGQLISYAILIKEKFGTMLQQCALLIFLIMTVAFGLFSYFPPRNFLFEDPRTHEYGIPQR